MNKLQFLIGAAAMAAGASAHAQIGLLGVTQTYPDVTLATNYLIWDNLGGVNNNIGKLRLVSLGAHLNEASGGDLVSQDFPGSYVLVIEADIERRTRTQDGTVLGTFVNGTVNIVQGLAGPTSSNPRWSWKGTITNLGINSLGVNGSANDYVSFDATWVLDNATPTPDIADTYASMPANMQDNPLYPNEFTTGWLTGQPGALKINTSVTWSELCGTGSSLTSCIKDKEWVIGSGLSDAVMANTNSGTIGAYLAALPNFTETGTGSASWYNNSVAADVFVTPPPAAPIPEMNTIGLMALGMTALYPLVRRRRQA